MTDEPAIMPEIDVAKLPGVKEAELLELGPCAVCGKGLFDREAASLTFYRLTISRGALLLDAARRRAGLGMMLGGTPQADAIARVLGPNDDLAKIIDGPVSVVVHETCAFQITHLGELMQRDADGR